MYEHAKKCQQQNQSFCLLVIKKNPTQPKPNQTIQHIEKNPTKQPNQKIKQKNSPKIQPEPVPEYNMKIKDRIFNEKSNF